jgi:cyanophycinase
MRFPRHFQGALLAAALAGCSATTERSAPPAAIGNIIIGGGMVHCSSMRSGAAGQCSLPWADIVQQDSAFAGWSLEQIAQDSAPPPVFSYRATPARLAQWAAMPDSLVAPQRKAMLGARLASDLAAPMPEGAFKSWAAALGASVAEQSALRHALVEPFAEVRPARKWQARSVRFMKDPATAAIYRTFVEAARLRAGGATPLIGVVTAAAGNPFNDHDIYVTALRSAGARVVWLPLSGGFRQALDQGRCDALPAYYSAYASTSRVRVDHMDLMFPDLAQQQMAACQDGAAQLNATLERLDGVFFSGGDQARLLESMVARGAPSAQLQILQRRAAAGQLVVAGSSAGDAIQAGGSWKGRPVPMIAGGTSLRALAEGFRAAAGATEEDEPGASSYAGGGFGLFRFGPLDSHFSNRGREARLVRLVTDSGLAYGFGVDENTALIVGRPDAAGTTTMTVIGAAGVMVVDARGAHGLGGPRAPYRVDGVRLHYLREGDGLSIDAAGQLAVRLAASTALPKAAQDGAPGTGKPARWSALAASVAVGGAPRAQLGIGEGSGPRFDVRLERDAATRMRVGAQGQVSYSGLLLRIAAATGLQ